MHKGLVSIIIPYHKKKKFFKKCFNSAYSQSYKNKEIIIVYDDNSKKELKFIKTITKKKKNIIILINKKKIGVGFSRNKGISISKGEFIAFLDADDIWKKNKLKKQIKYMNKKNISASFTGYEIINENDNKIGSRKSKKIITHKNLIYSCDIGLSTVILRKNKIIKNKLFPNLKTKEDYVFWLKLSREGINFYGISDKLTLWRKTRHSLSSNTMQKLIDGFKVYNYYLNFGFLKSCIHLFILSLNFLFKKYE